MSETQKISMMHDNLIENKLKYEELINEQLNFNYFIDKFNEKVEFIKADIDLRVESVKAKLDECRDDLLDQLEDFKKAFSSEILFNYNFIKIMNKH